MRTPQDIAADYLAAWNSTDDTERRALLGAWAPDAAYRDPLMSGAGREGSASSCATGPPLRTALLDAM